MPKSIEEAPKDPKATKPEKLPKKSNPKADLMAFLLGNGITKEEVGEFVLTTFGELDDLDKVKDIISPAKRDDLIEKIKKFLSIKAEKDMFEGIPPIEPGEENMFG